ncbi:hypothetical protein LF1_18670 [Rubripirellula obstinata]|uniref:Uncharacterized protein n=1 Tax=Rubripirellula obstinata TaxID=406547 RepID=A0A5B1CHC5_9BACT|nr:hypothetical protein [Rubripirellula obstinata]KAA1259335.1 hypothetical protein LF1_18670 [Rubripirellula obstinata]
MSKNKYTGKQLSREDRTEYLLLHCRSLITVADTCRMSGSPEVGIKFLLPAFDTMLFIIHQRFVVGHVHEPPTRLLENLKHGRHIGDVDFDTLRKCRAALVESPNGRDINLAIDGATLLSKIIKSDAFKEAKQRLLPGEDKRKPSRLSLFGRLSTAASVLFAAGSSS